MEADVVGMESVVKARLVLLAMTCVTLRPQLTGVRISWRPLSSVPSQFLAFGAAGGASLLK